MRPVVLLVSLFRSGLKLPSLTKMEGLEELHLQSGTTAQGSLQGDFLASGTSALGCALRLVFNGGVSRQEPETRVRIRL